MCEDKAYELDSLEPTNRNVCVRNALCPAENPELADMPVEVEVDVDL